MEQKHFSCQQVGTGADAIVLLRLLAACIAPHHPIAKLFITTTIFCLGEHSLHRLVAG